MVGVKEIKQQGVRGEKGFANAWMRAVMERDELAQYKQELGIENDIFAQQREGGAGIKFNEIPFLNEDLGLAMINNSNSLILLKELFILILSK